MAHNDEVKLHFLDYWRVIRVRWGLMLLAFFLVLITAAIVTLGSSLGLTIVAEGVETVEQWIALDEIGCTVGQGFLWSPPIPAGAFAPLITGLRRTARVPPSTQARAADAN